MDDDSSVNSFGNQNTLFRKLPTNFQDFNLPMEFEGMSQTNLNTIPEE